MFICFVIFYYSNKLILFLTENKIELKSDKNILKYMHACTYRYMYRRLLHPHGVPSYIPVVYPLTSLWCTLLLG